MKLKKIKFMDKLKHLLGIHKYSYIRRLSRDAHQIKCLICQKLFAMNTSVHVLLEWDLELEDFYSQGKMLNEFREGK